MRSRRPRPGLIKLVPHSPTQERLQLAHPGVLAAGIAEIVGGCESRGDLHGGMDGEAFIDQELAQGARLPVAQ